MLSPESSVADLVTRHPECARVLQRHKIDFCCHGERSLTESCRAGGLELPALMAELERVLSASSGELDLRALPSPALIRHIVERHHGYLREALPFVSGLARKVARVHGGSNANLLELEAVVGELCEALEPHLDDEETRLFPSLLDENADRARLRRDLDAMASEHRTVGALLERMRAAAEEYRVADWACGSYRALFGELERLEADVLRHVHAENHVLAPRWASASERA